MQETANCDAPRMLHHHLRLLEESAFIAPVYSSPSDKHTFKKARKIRCSRRKEEFYSLVQWYRLLHHLSRADMAQASQDHVWAELA